MEAGDKWLLWLMYVTNHNAQGIVWRELIPALDSSWIRDEVVLSGRYELCSNVGWCINKMRIISNNFSEDSPWNIRYKSHREAKSLYRLIQSKINSLQVNNMKCVRFIK